MFCVTSSLFKDVLGQFLLFCNYSTFSTYTCIIIMIEQLRL